MSADRGPVHVLVMGVAGSGKSTVAAALAEALGAVLIDGDDHQPAANVAKMASGRPLTDADRYPWLAALGLLLRANTATGHRVVLACSALRRTYRDRLRAAVPPGRLVAIELDAPEAILRARMVEREHFMPPELLPSQLATLEPLQDDERGVRLDADRPVADVVAEAIRVVAGVQPRQRT